MKLLLTSGGLTNPSIVKAFAELIEKDPQDSKIVFIPTAADSERGNKDWMINDLYRIYQAGYSVDIVDIAVLKLEEVLKAIDEADAIFVGGGNTFFLSYWLQKSGLFELLPKLLETKVYAGISAGSMITANSLRTSSQALKAAGVLKDEDYDELGPKGASSSKTLQLVDFEFRPHLNSEKHAELRNEANVRKVASTITTPIYALDDQSALKVIDDDIAVISEGKWLLLNSPNEDS